MTATPTRQNATPKDAHVEKGYDVTRWGAFWFCAGAFGTAIATMSFISYRRGLRQLVNEGFTEADANKVMPYAAQALGIATACVGGAGAAGSALLYASGVDLKESVRVSSARDAWTQMQAQSLGSAIGSRLRVLGEKVAAGLPPLDTSAAPKPTEADSKSE